MKKKFNDQKDFKKNDILDGEIIEKKEDNKDEL